MSVLRLEDHVIFLVSIALRYYVDEKTNVASCDLTEGGLCQRVFVTD